MASVVLHLFLPSVYLALIFYAAILFLGDLSVTCSIATLGVVLSALFLLNLSLPPNDKGKVERFLSVEQTEEQQPGDHVSFRKVDDHLTTTKVFTVGHRTLHLEAPENSLSGIKEVQEKGLDAVEFDVRFTKDKVPILFHDARVDRVFTNGVGEVANMTLNEVQKLDFSLHYLRREVYQGEKVITLTEAIDECLRLQLKIFIDVKIPNETMLKVLLDLYEANPDLYHQAIVVCWSPFFIYQLRWKNPVILTGLVWRPRMVSTECPTGLLEFTSPKYQEVWKDLVAKIGDRILDWLYHVVLWFPCGAAVILAHKDSISREYLKMWNQKGMKVLAWPVNDPEEKQYFTRVLKIGYLTDTHLQ